MDIYGAVGKDCVAGWTPGIYHYEPSGHSVSIIREGDLRREIAIAALKQMWISDAPLTFVITAEYSGIMDKYGQRGIRYAMIEAGHIGQNIFLQSQAIGLGSGIVGAFEDEKLIRVTGIKKSHEPLLIMPVGYGKETKTGGKKMEDIKVTSSAFSEGGIIPKDHTCEGKDISPPLAWTAVPGGTKSIALICDDPDAPMGTWVHWVIFNIPAGTRELQSNIPPLPVIQNGAKQGLNDYRKHGYRGPCPPGGTHRYYFKFYALDTEIDLPSETAKEQLLKAMEGHILAKGKIMGTYKR
jgi:Raf kinase inhibitor-like YbhB/YbcL family protein